MSQKTQVRLDFFLFRGTDDIPVSVFREQQKKTASKADWLKNVSLA